MQLVHITLARQEHNHSTSWLPGVTLCVSLFSYMWRPVESLSHVLQYVHSRKHAEVTPTVGFNDLLYHSPVQTYITISQQVFCAYSMAGKNSHPKPSVMSFFLPWLCSSFLHNTNTQVFTTYRRARIITEAPPTFQCFFFLTISQHKLLT